MTHGLYRFGPKMLAIVGKVECVHCSARRAVMATVAEAEVQEFLDYTSKRVAERVEPCKSRDGRHKWTTSVLASRSIAGHCMCEQCWPAPAAKPA